MSGIYMYYFYSDSHMSERLWIVTIVDPIVAIVDPIVTIVDPIDGTTNFGQVR